MFPDDLKYDITLGELTEEQLRDDFCGMVTNITIHSKNVSSILELKA